MNISLALSIFFSRTIYPYSSEADAVIKVLTEQGEYVGITNHRNDEGYPYSVYIKYNNMLYEVWINNRYYADLSQVFSHPFTKGQNSIFSLSNRTELYNRVSPSKRTKFKFWKWLFEQNPSILDRVDNKVNKKAIEEMLSNREWAYYDSTN